MNYFNHLTMIKADEIRKAGKWNSHLDGAQDYDMVLRVLKFIFRRFYIIGVPPSIQKPAHAMLKPMQARLRDRRLRPI